MQIEASTDRPLATDADTIAVGVFEDEGVAHDLPGGALEALLSSGEAGRAANRLAVTHHEGRRVILVGLGPRADFDAEAARRAAATVFQRAREINAHTLCWELPGSAGDEIVAALVTGSALSAYRFGRFRPPARDERSPARVIISAGDDVSAVVHRAAVIAAAQNRARDLGNTPANHLNPPRLADYAIELAQRHDLEVSVLDGEGIAAAGMGAIAAVSQGSLQDPRLIELRYAGAGESAPVIALLGKAVTFDTGGLALKPAPRMAEMKFDMCGGAAVIEAMAALAQLEVPARVLGIVGAVENMPGPGAVRPGDIVTALDGTTIQVDNPDAEGRMVLADCITHARRSGAAAIVDLATLTGAVESALGWAYAGLFANDDGLAERITATATAAGEPVWRLPLNPIYAEHTKGRDAVLTNRPEPRVALASSAAEFLHHFAGEVPWAHLDMYAVAFKGHVPYLDQGATGWGVRLLTELVSSWAA